MGLYQRFQSNSMFATLSASEYFVSIKASHVSSRGALAKPLLFDQARQTAMLQFELY